MEKDLWEDRNRDRKTSEGFLNAAEYNGKEKTDRAQAYLEADYGRGYGLMRIVAPL
jgi:hypothetical protein